ncbi:MAG: hypothetical protein V4858_20340 [Pseudomonadota bacterium]
MGIFDGFRDKVGVTNVQIIAGRSRQPRIGKISHQRLRLALALAFVLGGALASAIAVFTCRLACATAWPRKDPATRFAALSHMLMNGFFFNQGLLIQLLRCCPLMEG